MKKGRTGTKRESARGRGASERERVRQKERSSSSDLIIAVKEPKESHIVGRQGKMSL